MRVVLPASTARPRLALVVGVGAAILLPLAACTRDMLSPGSAPTLKPRSAELGTACTPPLASPPDTPPLEGATSYSPVPYTPQPAAGYGIIIQNALAGSSCYTGAMVGIVDPNTGAFNSEYPLGYSISLSGGETVCVFVGDPVTGSDGGQCWVPFYASGAQTANDITVWWTGPATKIRPSVRRECTIVLGRYICSTRYYNPNTPKVCAGPEVSQNCTAVMGVRG